MQLNKLIFQIINTDDDVSEISEMSSICGTPRVTRNQSLIPTNHPSGNKFGKKSDESCGGGHSRKRETSMDDEDDDEFLDGLLRDNSKLGRTFSMLHNLSRA